MSLLAFGGLYNAPIITLHFKLNTCLSITIKYDSKYDLTSLESNLFL